MAREEFKDLASYDYQFNFDNRESFKAYWMNYVVRSYKIPMDRVHIVSKMFDEQFKEEDLELNNTARGTSWKTKAMEFLKYIYENNIILTENGVMFRNQRDVESPTVYVEIKLGELRAVHKKEAIYYLTVGNDPIVGAYYNQLQNGDKTTINYCPIFI